MIVKTQKRIEFINDCSASFEEDELRSAILWYQQKPTARIKHIYIYRHYPSVSIYDIKIPIHRLLMMYWLKTRELSGYVVHHIDENKLNAKKDNLAVVPFKTHQHLHNAGKTLTEEHKEKIGIASRQRWNKAKSLTNTTPELMGERER